ncbi:hypothetical protein EMIT0357P_30333 [Pseudomonas marginalis]
MRRGFIAKEVCHDSAVLRRAGAFGNKLVQGLETDSISDTKTNVGGGLPPIAVCQPRIYRLIHRYRGQAPSHIF